MRLFSPPSPFPGRLGRFGVGRQFGFPGAFEVMGGLTLAPFSFWTDRFYTGVTTSSSGLYLLLLANAAYIGSAVVSCLSGWLLMALRFGWSACLCWGFRSGGC
jgi:hypothetical protein